MKRLPFILIPLLVTSMFSIANTSETPTNIAVYVESDTGYSWVRTYTGESEHVDGFVQVLEESYIRLAESMGAGSVLKIFVQGNLWVETAFEGDARAPYSGAQITVHDQFASQHKFGTSDQLPGYLADMESPQEPFVCGGKP